MTQLIDVSKVVPYCVRDLPLLHTTHRHLPLCLGRCGDASLGKRLLRLQIANRVTGEKPTRLRMILRTCWGSYSWEWLRISRFTPLPPRCSRPSKHFHLVNAQWIGYATSYGLLLSPMLLHRRYRILLHDWMSGTMVIDRPNASTKHSLAGVASHYRLPLPRHPPTQPSSASTA